MRKFVSEYSKKDQFQLYGDDLLSLRKTSNNTKEILDYIMYEAEKVIGPQHVKYKGFKWEDTSKNLQKLSNSNKKNKTDNKRVVDPNRTLARLAVFEFELKYDERNDRGVMVPERYRVKMPIYIPQIDKSTWQFLIRGSRYSAPIQIIESIYYPINLSTISMKFMITPITVRRTGTKIVDIYTGEEFRSHVFGVSLRVVKGKTIPIFMFYFSKFGIYRTLKYFGMYDEISFTTKDSYDSGVKDPNKHYFKFGPLIMVVDKEMFNSHYVVRQLIASILECATKSTNEENYNKTSYWLTRIGKFVSQQKSKEKGVNLVNIFINAFDVITAKCIADQVHPNHSHSIWTCMRWVRVDFTELVKKPDTLVSKRLRLGEYLCAPLIKDFIHSRLFSFVKMPEKDKCLTRLVDMFKVHPQIILNGIIGKGKSVEYKGKRYSTGIIDITKYDNSVNDCLYDAITACTFAGPGSPVDGASNSEPPLSMRDHGPDYVGRIDLFAITNSNPGMSRNLIGTVGIDVERMVFKTDGEVDREDELRNPMLKRFETVISSKDQDVAIG